MGKVCDNSRREAILHGTQNAAKPIIQPKQQLTSRQLDQRPAIDQRHYSSNIQIGAAAVSGDVSLNYPRNPATVSETFRA
jgi:hypothetical protein